MNTVKVNNHEFELTEQGNRLLYEGRELLLNIQKVNESYYHVLYNNKSIKVELIGFNGAEKTLQFRVNSNKYSVKLTDQYDQLLHKLGLDKALTQKISDLKAPMPGLVLKVLMKEGDQVIKGDTLIILEAMKMENIIKSPIIGTVKNIRIKEGDKLEKNQVMIVFE